MNKNDIKSLAWFLAYCEKMSAQYHPFPPTTFPNSIVEKVPKFQLDLDLSFSFLLLFHGFLGQSFDH